MNAPALLGRARVAWCSGLRCFCATLELGGGRSLMGRGDSAETALRDLRRIIERTLADDPEFFREA